MSKELGEKLLAYAETEHRAERASTMREAAELITRAVSEDWRPIKDAPEDTMLLLACDTWPPSRLRKETAPVKVGGFWDGAWHVFGASWQPTHWMKLPVKEMAA